MRDFSNPQRLHPIPVLEIGFGPPNIFAAVVDFKNPLPIAHWPLADNIVERQNAAKVSKEVLVQIAIIAVDGKKKEEVEKAMKINISRFYYLSLISELCQSSPFCFHWTRVRSVPGLVSNLITNSFCHVVES